MKDLAVFTMLDRLDEDVIMNTLPPSFVTGAPKRRRDSAFGRLMSSPAAAAVLSVIVAGGVLAGIILAGRFAGRTEPAPGETLPPTVTDAITDTVTESDTAETCPERIPTEGLAYALNENGTAYSVVGMGTATDTDIVIPSSHNRLPVRSIGVHAFSCEDDLTSIVLPDSIETIEWEAISRCPSLRSVTFGRGIEQVGEFAFLECEALTELRIADLTAFCHIEFTDEYANPLHYADKLYLNGVLVEELVIPEGTERVGDYAFAFYDKLTAVTFPASLERIGNQAFWHSSVTSVTIPEGLTTIGYQAFGHCTNLSALVLPDSVTELIAMAFAHCTSLAEVTLGAGPATVGDHAFFGCTALEAVHIREGLTHIGIAAFSDCSRLRELSLPTTLQSIAYRAFSGCDSLTTLHYGDTVAAWEAIPKDEGWSAFLPPFRIICTDGEVVFENGGVDRPGDKG